MEAAATEVHGIHVFIDKVRYDFGQPAVTGLELKTRAGARAIDGLYVKEKGQLREVGNEEVVQLKNGEHFSIVPDGQVS